MFNISSLKKEWTSLNFFNCLIVILHLLVYSITKKELKSKSSTRKQKFYILHQLRFGWTLFKRKNLKSQEPAICMARV